MSMHSHESLRMRIIRNDNPIRKLIETRRENTMMGVVDDVPKENVTRFGRKSSAMVG